MCIYYSTPKPNFQEKLSLQSINKKIHSVATPTEMNSKLAGFKSEIKTELLANGDDQERYYKNHTGRELYRKLDNFGMSSEITTIGDNYDGGFRPKTVNGIKT